MNKMKNLNQFAIGFLSIWMLFLSACGNGKQTDSKDQASEELSTQNLVDREEIFANDYTRVVKISLAPGEQPSPPRR